MKDGRRRLAAVWLLGATVAARARARRPPLRRGGCAPEVAPTASPGKATTMGCTGTRASTRPARPAGGERDLLQPARPHARRLQPRRRAGRAEARARSRRARADLDERRPHLHVQAQARHRVRTAGRARDHREGHPLRDRALARPRNGSLFALVFADIQGFDAYRAGKAKSISGIRTPSAKTIVFHADPAGR